MLMWRLVLVLLISVGLTGCKAEEAKRPDVSIRDKPKPRESPVLPVGGKVAVMPEPNASVANWAGHWQTEFGDKDINIKLVDNNASLFVEGYGTYGTDDPERMKRGSISVGQFAAQGPVHGRVFEFADGNEADSEPGIVIRNSVMGESKTLSYNTDRDDLCKIRLRIYPDKLIAEDNMKCGGHNFSFRDTYFRSKEKVWWWNEKGPLYDIHLPDGNPIPE